MTQQLLHMMSIWMVLLPTAWGQSGTWLTPCDSSLAATFSYPDSNFCIANANPQMPTISGTLGGVFSIDPAGSLSLDSLSGMFLPEMAGDYTITYTVTDSVCTVSQTYPVHIGLAMQAAFHYPNDTFCRNAISTALLPIITGQAGGTFSSTVGLVLDSISGAIDGAASATGQYSIQYAIAAPCPDTQTFVLELPDVDSLDLYYVNDLGQIDSALWTCSTYFPLVIGDSVVYFYESGWEFPPLYLDPYTGIISPGGDWDNDGFYIIGTTGGVCPVVDSFHFYVAGCQPTITLPEAASGISLLQPSGQRQVFVQSEREAGRASLRVQDITGRLWYEEQAVMLMPGNPYPVLLPDHAPFGVYLLSVHYDWQVVSFRILLTP